MIIEFYTNTNTIGYTLDQILGWNDANLEKKHDYIQILFPLTEKSNYNKNAPILTEKDISQFRTNKLIRSNVKKALERMLTFYGFSKPKLYYVWDGKKDQWLTKQNHNFLRLTRIMKFLQLINMKYESIRIFLGLCDIYKSHRSIIGSQTMDIWKQLFLLKL